MESIPFRLGKIRSKYVIALIYSHFVFHLSQKKMWEQSKKSRTLLIRNYTHFKTNSVPAEEINVELRFNLLNGFKKFMLFYNNRNYEAIRTVFKADIEHKDISLNDFSIINYSLKFEEGRLSEVE